MERFFSPTRAERVWLLSPPAVTAVFLVAQAFFYFQAPETASTMVGASAAKASASDNVQVRVVAEIKPAARPSAAATMPETEAELWTLLRRDGQVMFFADEVEVLTTPAQRFAEDEVGVITVDGGTERE